MATFSALNAKSSVRFAKTPLQRFECVPPTARAVEDTSRPLRSRPSTPRRSLPPSQAISQDDMLGAEKRWNAQLAEGKVRNITTKGAGNLLKEGWTLLDVRPPSETKVASVVGAVEVPVFLPDESLNPASLLKQMSAFGMGGWWLGGTHMEPNKDFLAEVQQKIPKDANLIVICQKGLRSLAACEQLSKAGYQTIAWVNGGLDTAKPGDLPSEGDKDLRLAGIGGVSAMLGWTELQQEGKKGFGDNVENILKVAAIIVFLDLLVFGYEQIQYMTSQ